MKIYFLFHGANTRWLILTLAFSISTKAKICKQIIPTEHCLDTSHCLKKESQLQAFRTWPWRHHHHPHTSLKGQVLSSSPTRAQAYALFTQLQGSGEAKARHFRWGRVPRLPQGSQTAQLPTRLSQTACPALAYVDSRQQARLPCYFGILAGVKKRLWGKASHLWHFQNKSQGKKDKILWVITIGSALLVIIYTAVGLVGLCTMVQIENLVAPFRH